MGSTIFAIGISFWVWFFRNLLKNRLNRAKLFIETNKLIIIFWNSLCTIVGLMIYPIPKTIPLLALIIGLLLGWHISRSSSEGPAQERDIHLENTEIEKPADNSQPLDVSERDKIFFIRNLAKRRIMNNSVIASMPPGNIDNLPDTMILGLPEATIAYIVDTYLLLKRQGSSENDALKAIENHRASFGDSGTLPSPLTLQNYIKYRLKIEHSGGAPISQEFINRAIKEAVGFFTGEVELKEGV